MYTYIHTYIHTYVSKPSYYVGVRMEFQSVAGGNRLHSSDRYVEQNSLDRKHHLSLRGGSRPLPLLLHPQLDLPILLRRFLLLDTDPLRRAADWPLCGLPILLLSEYTRGQTGNRAAHVNDYYTIVMNILIIMILPPPLFVVYLG